jgi:dipeptidyl-peptidase-3
LTADEELTFIHSSDVDLCNAWDSRILELQVANHELLGRGSGKLFQEQADGSSNFDPERIVNPLTGEKMYVYLICTSTCMLMTYALY